MRNRRGFTLIEMMVVIAIIAVLVAVIIPVMGNATTKARAATNAANLRSVEGEVVTMMLLQPDLFDKNNEQQVNDVTNAKNTVAYINAQVTRLEQKKDEAKAVFDAALSDLKNTMDLAYAAYQNSSFPASIGYWATYAAAKLAYEHPDVAQGIYDAAVEVADREIDEWQAQLSDAEKQLGDAEFTLKYVYTAQNGVLNLNGVEIEAPVAKEIKDGKAAIAEDTEMTLIVDVDNKTAFAKYGNLTKDDFAAVADDAQAE